MKKITAMILVIISTVCLFSGSVSASDIDYSDYPDYVTEVSRYPGYTTVGFMPERPGNYEYSLNMVRNPYYQKYYNELLNYSCQVYKKDWMNTANKRYIKSYAAQYLVLPENYTTLIFSTPEETPESIREYNRSILVRYFNEEDIIYVSDYDYAAVVCIRDTKSYVVNKIHELEFIGDAFFTKNPSIMMPMTGDYAMGDVYSAETEPQRYADVTAADARFLLRYVAGLEEVGADKKFYFCADMNFDNKIDSADARLVLRTAAGLEKKSYIGYGYFQYWDDTLGVLNYEK